MLNDGDCQLNTASRIFLTPNGRDCVGKRTLALRYVSTAYDSSPDTVKCTALTELQKSLVIIAEIGLAVYPASVRR